ncbi:MAG: hypothetical protein CHACPFDD_00476 [Phycisphaerae bacterium]|nr:hypothetical protein [Phycisphaerae bacterium]
MNTQVVRCGLGMVLAGLVLLPTALADSNPVDDQVVVRLVPGADLGAFLARYPQVVEVRAAIASRDTYLLILQHDAGELEFVDMLNAGGDPDALWAEENYDTETPEGTGRNFFLNTTPNPTVYQNQSAWGQINMGGAHTRTTGAGIIVAVLDTGVDATHVALSGRVLAYGWNFIDDNADTDDAADFIDSDADGTVDEMYGHGTHVAGIVAAVAPMSQILPVKVLDSDGRSDNFRIALAMEYALDAGATVINMSLGSTYKSSAIEDAADRAYYLGVPVVGAAGNLNRERPEEYPAFLSHALSVAAVDANDVKSDFSNYNKDMVLSAPGEGIYSTIPGDLYAQWDGTSMSAPMAAGAAALLIAQHPEWPPTEERDDFVAIALYNAGVDINATNPGYQDMLGHRLDIAAAVGGPCTVGCKGDLNCDGFVDGFDIVPFVVALSNPADYADKYPGCDITSADCNIDGSVNGYDIDWFIETLQ